MMARKLGLPFKKDNPRTVRGARKRGWSVIDIGQGVYKDEQCQASWVGLNIWAERNASGHWISSFALGQFAFERDEDASMFILKWKW